MTLIETNRLVEDLRAVVAAITPSQIQILTSIQEVVAERINELNEEIAEDGNDQESNEENTSEEV